MRVAAADALPRVPGPRAGPQSAQPVGQSLVLDLLGEWDAQPVAPFQPTRVVHAAQQGLGRHPSGADHQRVQRKADVPVAHARHQTLELRGGAVPLVGPDPKAAVAVPATLPVGRVGRGRVGPVQVVVEHLQEGLLVGRVGGAPEVVGVIVRSQVDALGQHLRGHGQGQPPARGAKQAAANERQHPPQELPPPEQGPAAPVHSQPPLHPHPTRGHRPASRNA